MKTRARGVPVSPVVDHSSTRRNPTSPPLADLGENPVDKFYARRYALESSPSTMAVIQELTENARDNATDVRLIIDVERVEKERGLNILIPRSITCEDNGVGLTHREYLQRFCGAYSDSDAHHDVERAGRNGVGTKTYLSIADRVLVATTTARATDGLDDHRDLIASGLTHGLQLPRDGEADLVWRSYEFRLHNRAAIPSEWRAGDEYEMGTKVQLMDLHPGTRIYYELLRERLSYAREWLSNGARSFSIQLTGDVPDDLPRRLPLKPWQIPDKSWLVEAIGNSSEPLTILDRLGGKHKVIEPLTGVGGTITFDFRAGARDPIGDLKSIEKPAIIFEVCGAVPYAPQLDGNQSSRTLPLLAFLGLENVSSIGSFQNSICGWGRINSLELKQALRNNKTTLAGGPDANEVLLVREYLRRIIDAMHDIWYNATRNSQDDLAAEPLRDATAEVNLALAGVNRNPFKGGDIVRRPTGPGTTAPTPTTTRRHRWECGSCDNRWLADIAFKPTRCSETSSDSGVNDGCGSDNIGLAKNQPRIGECKVELRSLGDERVVATFQLEQAGDDLQLPVVRINTLCPRYVELRGTTDMSKQAQGRLRQYFIDSSLVAIAEYHALANGRTVSEELGDLYFNRMTRSSGGIKQYKAALTKMHVTESTAVANAGASAVAM